MRPISTADECRVSANAMRAAVQSLLSSVTLQAHQELLQKHKLVFRRVTDGRRVITSGPNAGRRDQLVTLSLWSRLGQVFPYITPASVKLKRKIALRQLLTTILCSQWSLARSETSAIDSDILLTSGSQTVAAMRDLSV